MYNTTTLTGTRSSQTSAEGFKKAFAVIGTVILGTGSAYGMDRAEVWRHHLQPRVGFVVDSPEKVSANSSHADVRTPAEHVENIRKVLNPAIADLANLFDISRQAIYKWLSGESSPEPEKMDRLLELSRIADAFSAANILRAGSMLKMKTFDGRSLMDLLKAGESCSAQVATLIAEAKAMEASYGRSGIAESKAKPTSDWQSSISIPGFPEEA